LQLGQHGFIFVKLLKVKTAVLNIFPSLHLGQRPLKMADDLVFFTM